MADFLLAIRPVLSIEGYSQNKRTGYVTDTNDAGGETEVFVTVFMAEMVC